MSEINCIIIEDEPLAVKVLTDYIHEVPFLKLQGSFRDAIAATEFLRENTTDLIFLDIHLPKLKGLAFLKTLAQKPDVIVTTAYHQYAVEGFNMNVTDYLLKPFDFERFLVAVNKVKSRRREAEPSREAAEKKNAIFLSVQKKKVRILFSDIVYIESQREYVKVVTTGEEYLSKVSTHELEDALPSQLFKRIHRSYIIALDKIKSYNADSVELTGISLPIGRAYRHVLENG